MVTKQDILLQKGIFAASFMVQQNGPNLDCSMQSFNTCGVDSAKTNTTDFFSVYVKAMSGIVFNLEILHHYW